MFVACACASWQFNSYENPTMCGTSRLACRHRNFRQHAPSTQARLVDGARWMEYLAPVLCPRARAHARGPASGWQGDEMSTRKRPCHATACCRLQANHRPRFAQDLPKMPCNWPAST